LAERLGHFWVSVVLRYGARFYTYLKPYYRMRKLFRWWRTVRHLRFEQLFYRLYYRWKRPSLPRRIEPICMEHLPRMRCTLPSGALFSPPSEVELLNIRKHYRRGVDWNDFDSGLLWAYHHWAIPYLHSRGVGVEDGKALVKSFIEGAACREAYAPWPMSRRMVHLITWACSHGVDDPLVHGWIREQERRLWSRLEWHLMANHLLENLLALGMAAVYFDDARAAARCRRLLLAQLKEQILPDGGHIERSPMYQAEIIHRLLDLYCIQVDNLRRVEVLPLEVLADVIAAMLGWLEKMSSESGYYRFERSRYVFVVDAGEMGPDYQPGHGHCDALSFVLYVDGQPVFVDTGVSTYARGAQRLYERSTAAHNTVTVEGDDQAEVWAAFRVGRRYRIVEAEVGPEELVAAHDGYQRYGGLHRRRFVCREGCICIEDRWIGRKGRPNPQMCAYFHLHPRRRILSTGADTLRTDVVELHFQGHESWQIEQTPIAEGFFRRKPAHCVKVRFCGTLQTEIRFT